MPGIWMSRNKIGRKVGQERERLLGIAGLGGDLDLGVVGQQAAEFHARQTFVINDDGSHAGLGIGTVATTWPSSRFRSFKLARPP